MGQYQGLTGEISRLIDKKFKQFSQRNTFSNVWIEYKNASWLEVTDFTFDNEYTSPPSVTCSLVYDIAADNAGRTVPTNDIIPMIDLLIDNRSGTLYYIGCRVRWTGTSVPGSITNGYTSIIVVGKV